MKQKGAHSAACVPAQIDTWRTHTRSHTSSELSSVPLIHTFLHIGRIRNTFSWVCEAAPHTKKHLGTGLVGLQRIHICPVQAIGIQSFTLSNATKREQSRPALFFALAAPLWEGLFCWANNEPVNTHFYCSTRGISLAKDRAPRRVWDRLYYPGLKCWVGGWVCRRMDGQTDGGMEGCWGGGQRRSASVTSTCYCWWPVPPLHLHKTDLEETLQSGESTLSSSIYTILTQFTAFSQYFNTATPLDISLLAHLINKIGFVIDIRFVFLS